MNKIKLIQKYVITCLFMLSRFRGVDWILDLLTQLGITTLSLISTLYKSLAHTKSSQSSSVVSWQQILTQ
jgi:16S rRNA U1498 N3-methylase RsmE